jgi:DNA-binding NarL/FixJ family response regulator
MLRAATVGRHEEVASEPERSQTGADPDARAGRRCDDGVLRPSVLIVDDHAGFRAFARALLEAEGFVVVGEAPDGASALAAVRDLRPRFVLLDIHLPDFDGFAVCERLAEAGGELPVVVLTSTREASSYRRRLDASGASAFIPKAELTGARLAAIAGGS